MACLILLPSKLVSQWGMRICRARSCNVVLESHIIVIQHRFFHGHLLGSILILGDFLFVKLLMRLDY